MNKRMLCVYVDDDTEFDFGQKLYVITVKRNECCKSIYEKCQLCGDTKEITVKGYTFACPMCRGGTTYKGATTIDLYNYIVTEYIINHFEVEGSNFKNAYSADGLLKDLNLPKVKWSGFSRWGNGYSDTERRIFSSFDVRDRDPDDLDIKRNASGIVFYTKPDATRFCKRLHERQKELLNKFNKEHGTNHQYPFKY